MFNSLLNLFKPERPQSPANPDAFNNQDAVTRWLALEAAQDLLAKADVLDEPTPADVRAVKQTAAAKLESYRLKLANAWDDANRKLAADSKLFYETDIPIEFREAINNKRKGAHT